MHSRECTGPFAATDKDIACGTLRQGDKFGEQYYYVWRSWLPNLSHNSHRWSNSMYRHLMDTGVALGRCRWSGVSMEDALALNSRLL